MLKKVIVLNFRSITTKTEIDFTATKYGILDESNVADNIVKGGLFIGPNASGKSTALLAINFILIYLRGEEVGYTMPMKCLFSDEVMTELDYYFEFSGKEVRYRLCFDQGEKISKEWLYVDDEVVLQRLGAIGYVQSDSGGKSHNEELNPVSSFFRKVYFDVGGKFRRFSVLGKFMQFIISSTSFSILHMNWENRALGVGEIGALSRGMEKANEFLREIGYGFALTKSPDFSVGGRDGLCLERNGIPIKIFLADESCGNRVFVYLLIQILIRLENPGMIVIDEFGGGLHNKLAEKLIRHFMKHAAHSQIFLASHSTNLLSHSVLRPDQIYLATFEGERGTKFKRFSDFKPREAQNIEKMYLGGMFEGLPDYDNPKV